MILVTGAAGLLGRELLGNLCDAGHNVIGADVSPSPESASAATWVTGDLRDAAVCERACRGCRSVIHAAARQYHSGVPHFGRRAFFHANVEMTRSLVEAACVAGVRRFVYVSSDMVYGLPPDRPIREEDEPRPIGPYGASKLAGEQICEAARERGLSVVILRPRLIVGPGRLGVLRRLFERIRSGGRVPMLGRGENRYQMVGVSDVARACILAAQSDVQATFNLGSADPPKVRDLLAELCRRAGRGARARSLPARPALAALSVLDALRISPLTAEQFKIATRDYVLDTRRAARDLGWRPQYSDTEMLWQAYETYLRRA